MAGTITVGSEFIADPDEASFDLTERVNNLDASGSKSWLDETYEGYEYKRSKWQYVNDHYTLQVLDPDKVREYLRQRRVAEHADDYAERIEIAACVPYLSSSIDQINGMVSAVEPDIDRQWSEPERPETGFGDPEEEGSPAYILTNNYNGSGMNVVPFWQRVGTELLKYMEGYILVVGAGDNKRDPCIRWIDPWAVTNFMDDNGLTTDIVVKHEGDARTSIKDPVATVEMRTHYHVLGWDTYKKTKDGYALHDSGKYNYYQSKERLVRTLPIFRLALPMSRNVAFQAAKQQNRIFNTESEMQMAMRKGMMPIGVFRGTPDKFKEDQEKRKKGWNSIMQHPDIKEPHYFMTQPTEPADQAMKVVEMWEEDMLQTIFREYSDAAQLKTATQIRQESRSSLESILVHLSDTLDEGENTAMHLMAQAWFPNDSTKWDVFNVRRSKKFQPVDADSVIQGIRDRYIGRTNRVPAGRSAVIDAVKKIADHDGIAYVDEEIDADVDAERDQSAVDNAALNFRL